MSLACDCALYGRALVLGIVSGMRSMMAPALAARAAAEDPESMPPLLAQPQTRAALGLMAAGEMVVDKLPFTPSRTVLPSLVVRAISGAVVGGALASSRRGSSAAGAVVGAIGAVAGAYGAYHARKFVDQKLNLPDPIVGMAEDALAARIGMKALGA